jgi:glycosyltransferase involved in cell wall biosynthesis
VSSNKAPLVSVIIPTRNRAYILRSAIQSILRQTHKNLEIIIVDDNSTDSTSKVVENIAKDNHNIKYIRNDIHRGLPASRNIGLSYAKGNLIFFSEDDLILMPNTIEILVKTYSALSKKYKVGAVAPRLILVSSTRIYSPLHECTKIIGYFNMLTGDHCANYDVETSHILLSEHPPATSLIPREIFNIVGTYYTGYKYNYLYEDSDLYYRILKHGFIMFYQPRAIAFHISGNPGGCTVNK